jgi:hypothetical protein
MTTIRHQGRWRLDDRFASAWHYLPVEVPPGAAGLHVELEYDRRAATLDLGCFGPGGFRGWSGGARRSFVIAADAATPGYLPGELEPGPWQIAIGLVQIPPGGVDYRITAEISRTPGNLRPEPGSPPCEPVTARPPQRRLPAAPGRQWLAGDLHTHTVHSDGAMTVDGLASFAATRGLDFLAVTDHNTVSHHAELPVAGAAHRIALLPGQEVTRAEGHAGVLGDVGWVDFREPADHWLAATEVDGGLMSVNHPIGGHVSWTMPMTGRPPLLEVWHWSWLDLHWTNSLSWWLAWDPAAIPVGGSDWHRPGSDAPPGTPTTWAETETDDPRDTSPDAVLAAAAAGRTAISASRDGPVLLRSAGELIAVGAEGTVLAGPDGPCALVRSALERFGGRPGWHRLLDPSGATLALTA